MQEVVQLSQDKFSYNFSTINSIDCELVIPILINNRLLKSAFQQELKKRKLENEKKGSYEEIVEFKVPHHLFNLIRVQTKTLVENCKKDIESDGVVKINYLDIDNAIYKKNADNGEKWLVVLVYKGSYKKV